MNDPRDINDPQCAAWYRTSPLWQIWTTGHRDGPVERTAWAMAVASLLPPAWIAFDATLTNIEDLLAPLAVRLVHDPGPWADRQGARSPCGETRRELAPRTGTPILRVLRRPPSGSGYRLHRQWDSRRICCRRLPDPRLTHPPRTGCVRGDARGGRAVIMGLTAVYAPIHVGAHDGHSAYVRPLVAMGAGASAGPRSAGYHAPATAPGRRASRAASQGPSRYPRPPCSCPDAARSSVRPGS